MKKLGFLGLGIMGSPMARNLLKGGFDVTVWNRTPERAAILAAEGASVASMPQEVTARCDLTFAMLADPAAAREVALGASGAAAGIGKGRGYIDMSTVDPETSSAIAAAVTAAGGRFLEAPVSGSKKPAEDATLIIMAAGDRGLHDEALPALERMGKKVLFLGETGSGARMKIVVNMIMGVMMAGLAEGLALAGKSGLSSEDLLEILDSGAMSNPMFRLKGGLMGRGDFTPAFPLKHMQKDLRLAVAQGDEAGQPLQAAAAVNELFKQGKALGFGNEDFSAVLKALK